MIYQRSVATYDALNRITSISDPQFTTTYEYDAVGNRIHLHADYTDGLGGATGDPNTSATASASTNGRGSEDYWYQYDQMNRMTISIGKLAARGASATDASVAVGVVFSRDTTSVNDDQTDGGDGVAITYDKAGQRITATYASDGHKESYTYNSDGNLADVQMASLSTASKTVRASFGNALLRTRRFNDLSGRVTNYIEWNVDNNGNRSVIVETPLICDRNNYRCFLRCGKNT